jgi:hypothetical protein
MKRLVSLIFVSFFLLTCATTPPPRIEENYYQNYQYGLALELPGGAWKPTKKMPAQFRQAFVAQGASTRNVTLMLFNNETQATIMVYCEKRRTSGDLSAVSRSQLVDALQKEFEKKRGKILKNDKITSFTYNVWLDNSEVRWTFDLDVADQMMKAHVIAQAFLYQLGANICVAQVMLASNVLTYEQNLEVFNQMWTSLRYGEEYTAEQ